MLKSTAKLGHQPATLSVHQEQSKVGPQEGANAQQGSYNYEAGAASVAEEQAHQAAAAGMDAFEHSQALAERRASGSMAGPSTAVPSFPGLSPPLASIKPLHPLPDCDPLLSVA